MGSSRAQAHSDRRVLADSIQSSRKAVRSRRSTLLARDYRAGVTKADVPNELLSHVPSGPNPGAACRMARRASSRATAAQSISGSADYVECHNSAFMLHTMRAVQDWLHLDRCAP